MGAGRTFPENGRKALHKSSINIFCFSVMTTVFSLTSLADLGSLRMYRKLGRVAAVPACRRLRQEDWHGSQVTLGYI